jgi:hypothetical protein
MIENTYRTKNTQTFGKALQAQNQYLSSLCTIPIVGVTVAMMHKLDSKILAVEGVSDVLRPNKTGTIG